MSALAARSCTSERSRTARSAVIFVTTAALNIGGQALLPLMTRKGRRRSQSFASRTAGPDHASGPNGWFMEDHSSEIESEIRRVNEVVEALVRAPGVTELPTADSRLRDFIRDCFLGAPSDKSDDRGSSA